MKRTLRILAIMLILFVLMLAACAAPAASGSSSATQTPGMIIPFSAPSASPSHLVPTGIIDNTRLHNAII